MLRFSGAGRDEEDLGGMPVGRAVGSLRDAGRRRLRRAPNVPLHAVMAFYCSSLLVSERCRNRSGNRSYRPGGIPPEVVLP